MDQIDTQMTEANTVADALKLADEFKGAEVFVQTNEDLDNEPEATPTVQ